MKYRLLQNDVHGVLLDRTPIDITGDLILEFEGLPSGEYTVTAVVKDDTDRIKRIYRKIYDGKAIIERGVFDRYVSNVSICVKNADLTCEWMCDGLILSGSCVYADHSNTEDTLRELRVKLDESLSEISELRREVGELSTRLSEIYDGYDVI